MDTLRDSRVGWRRSRGDLVGDPDGEKLIGPVPKFVPELVPVLELKSSLRLVIMRGVFCNVGVDDTVLACCNLGAALGML